jgi:hypothetical protein
MADLAAETRAIVDKACNAAVGLPARTLSLGLHSILLELAELREGSTLGSSSTDLNVVSRKLLEQAQLVQFDLGASVEDQDFSFILSAMLSGVSREILAIRNALATGSIYVSDVAFGASWNGVTLVAPSKNAVYDQIIAVLAVIAAHEADTTGIHGIVDTADLGLKSNPLSQFAATSSAQLAGVISDETGSGLLVFASSPILTTPNIGAANGLSLQLSGLTASEILGTDASKNLVSLAVATYPSLAELAHVKGVTSAIQTQLNAKQALDAALTALAAFNTNGVLVQTAPDTFAGRSVAVTASTGLSISNGDGVAGNPTLAGIDASTTVKGVVELATDAETTTGTDATRVVTPDGLAGSTIFGVKSIGVQVIDGATTLTTGDGKAYIRVPAALNGMNIIRVAAQVIVKSTSGTPTVQVARGRQSTPTTDFSFVDVLSTLCTIDANEYDSKDAAAAMVVNASNDDLATGDVLRIDVDVAGTGTRGLNVVVECQLP